MRTRIKFCGFVQAEDVRTAVSLGVDAVGFVFYPKSPRYVAPEQASALRRLLPSWVSAVGLFVNEAPPQVQSVRREVGLDVLQFHGDESPEHCLEAACGAPWWRAVRMSSPGVLLESSVRYPQAEALLLDSFSSGYGGSGATFEWSWIPASRPIPLVLSGGLKPETAGAAIEAVRPFAVDVSSGIQCEGEPRRKSAHRMARFVAEVLQADARVASRARSLPGAHAVSATAGEPVKTVSSAAGHLPSADR